MFDAKKAKIIIMKKLCKKQKITNWTEMYTVICVVIRTKRRPTHHFVHGAMNVVLAPAVCLSTETPIFFSNTTRMCVLGRVLQCECICIQCVHTLTKKSDKCARFHQVSQLKHHLTLYIEIPLFAIFFSHLFSFWKLFLFNNR